MQNPYEALGVPRTASKAEIRKAYRAQAKKFHPDLNPGNAKAEERFKTLSIANELLSDTVKRAQFDRGEIDASGQDTPQQSSYRDYAEREPGRRYGPAGAESGGWRQEDLDSMFGSIFEDMSGRGGRTPHRGADQHYTLAATFLEAINGATRRLTLPDGRTIDVKIPPGTIDGQTLRLRGQGGGGRNGGTDGDALIELHVTPHEEFIRDGQDIRVEVPVGLRQAVLGGSIEVPTPSGAVRMKVPPHSDSGTILRLRGRGVPAAKGIAQGDLYAKLKIVLGPIEAPLEDFLREWPDEKQNVEAEA